MRVLITPDAEADLEEIAEYIAQDNPLRAATFTAALRKKALAIGRFPRAYPARPFLGADCRIAVARPYAIVFRINRKQVEVLRILHGARDITALMPGG